jgi:hypothetical protein
LADGLLFEIVSSLGYFCLNRRKKAPKRDGRGEAVDAGAGAAGGVPTRRDGRFDRSVKLSYTGDNKEQHQSCEGKKIHLVWSSGGASI